MRASAAGVVAAAAAIAVGLACCTPTEQDEWLSREAALRRATITLRPEKCAGVVIGDGAHALTAAHCLDGAPIEVLLSNGEVIGAVVASLDPEGDLALLRFDAPVPVMPLAVASEPSQVGDTVFFAGRPGRAGALQQAEIQRLGRCPSLPAVPDALFTTIEGLKGDSGAPLVDRELRVVGLVHGGAACSIAAPTLGALSLLAQDGVEVAARAQARRGPRFRLPPSAPGRAR